MARKNEFEVFPELIRVEDDCASFEPAFVMLPASDLVIDPPSTTATEPKANRRTIETTAIDLFNHVTRV